MADRYMLRILSSILSRLHEFKTRRYLAGLLGKGLVLGKGTEILEPFFIDPDHCFLVSIGANCTLAPNVRLIAHDASTKRHLGYTRIGKITINDNCFIGDSVIILPNVTVGANSIIGAGTLVNRDIPPGSVAAGNPVRIICKLEEYLEKVRARAEQSGVYGEEYLITNISPEGIRKMLESLDGREGYIV